MRSMPRRALRLFTVLGGLVALPALGASCGDEAPTPKVAPQPSMSGQTPTGTAPGTPKATAAPAKTGNAGLLVESNGSGILLPGALAVGTVVLVASGWYIAGRRRA